MDSAHQQQQQQRQLRSDCDEEEDGRDVEMQAEETPDPKVAKKRVALMGSDQQEAAAIPPKMEASPNKSQMFWDRYVLRGQIDKGTFSTVSLATLRTEQHLSLDKQRQFAIKLITPTSHPSRIAREILCMMRIGGQCNVVGFVDGFRFQDSGSVGIVMKYIPQEPFNQYYAQMTPGGVQRYMQQMLIALERVHLFGVIHRDVKPSNFLHSPRNGGGQYVLVDFGLAQETDKGVLSLRTPEPPRQAEGKREDQVVPQHQDTVVMRNPLKRQGSNNTHPLKLSNSMTKDLADVPLARHTKSTAGIIGNGLRHRRSAVLENRAPCAKDLKSGGGTNASVAARPSSNLPSCNCPSRPQVCNMCLVKPEMTAPRAGTPGYRPPEVLLKHPDQTTAVDIWAAGVIFLSLLSKLYPFFNNVDDTTALAQIIEVFGFQRINETARALKRTLLCNAETMERQPYNLRRLCQHFRTIYQGGEMGSKGTGGDSGTPIGGSSPPSGRDEENFCCTNCCKPPDGCVCQRRRNVPDGDDERTRDTDCDEYGSHAYDLLERLLETNPDERITASEALQHPYFKVQY